MSLMRSIPNFAPDGFAAAFDRRSGDRRGNGAGASRLAPESKTGDARQPEYTLLSQEGYDEGLVHSHRWACSQ